MDGNERVVAARLYDAKFFYDEDLKKPLEAYVEGLSEVVFQEALGTTLEKTKRIVKVARAPCGAGRARRRRRGRRRARGATCARPTWSRAPWWSSPACRASWAATMRAASGETPEVAQAIADHYRPRFAGRRPARRRAVGKVVAMADKLDTICGLFAIGQGAHRLVRPVRAAPRGHRHRVHPVRAARACRCFRAIDVALERYAEAGHRVRPGGRARRGDGLLRDAHEGHAARRGPSPPTPSTPCWPSGVEEPMGAGPRACARWKPRAPTTRDTFDDLATAYARANNLRRRRRWAREVDEALLGEAERDLARAVEVADAACRAALAADDYAARPGGPGGPARPHRPLLRATCWSWTRTRPCARTGCAC